MTSSTVVIPYSIATTSSEDPFIVEQEDWGKNVGVVTKYELLRYVSSRAYDHPYTPLTDCGMVDGLLSCPINVYPRKAGSVYRLKSSWGGLSGARGGLAEVEEIINFTLTSEERVKYPCRAVREMDWLSECYDADGAVVEDPAIAIDGDTLSTAVPVYGSIQIRYQTEKYTHMLSIPKRETSLEEFFSAVVYVLYDGGIVWKEIDLPNNFDESTAADRCGLSGSGSVTWPDEDPRSVADNPYRRHTLIDYCSQTVVSDTIV